MIRSLLALCAVFGIAGCRPAESKVAPTPESFSAYGDLQGLRRSPHVGLQAELARLVDERATPVLLEQYRTRVVVRGEPRGQVADRDNAAAALIGILEPASLKRLNDRLAAIWPVDGFEFGDDARLDAQILLAEFEPLRRRFIAAASRPACDFRFQHACGLMADTSWVEVVTAGVRLEELAAAQALHENRPAEAVNSLAISFRMCQFLAAEWHLVPRMQAANLRAESLVLLEAIATHPRANTEVRQQLLSLMAQQLNAWPRDSQAWIGDRAEGLHTYEIVRDGHLLSVLSSQELRRLRETGKLRATLESVREHIDQDELHYLTTMRRLLEICDKPYYERQPLFAEIRTQLDELARSAEFPFVAANLLLADFERGHRLQARDRALCEAWAIGLALAINQEPPPYRISPLTSAPYRFLRQKDHVVVWGVLPPGEDRQLLIPRPAEQTARKPSAEQESTAQ